MALVALTVTALTACGSSGGTKPVTSPEELTNFSLGPQYSSWMVGPIGAMASVEERTTYLALDGDFAAADFIEEFWRRRDPDPSAPGNPVRELFEGRVVEADKRYTEAGFSGSRTARGIVYVLHGEPDESEYEIDAVDGRPFEVWRYTDGETGLDGTLPSVFRFRRQGDLTTFYTPRIQGAARRP